RAGSTTAIVGPSGSGKSTVLALLAGLYRPTAGTVRVDGTDLAELDDRVRRRLARVVIQEPYLLPGTIADNGVDGRPDVTRSTLAAVARLARGDEIISRVPDGWHTAVGETGAALSGGERQRVSIARALAKPAPILLVDEATSALDAENEKSIVGA